MPARERGPRRTGSLLARTNFVLGWSAVAIAVTAITATDFFVISPMTERSADDEAGLIVLSSSVLALTVHPAFAGVAIFVGAGLVFAGLTDTCGMGMLLAKMPWNQVATECDLSRTPSAASGTGEPT